jgi:hypothetical protein
LITSSDVLEELDEDHSFASAAKLATVDFASMRRDAFITAGVLLPVSF